MQQRTVFSSNESTTSNWWLIFFAWLIAASGSLGALFFGEVMGIAPCTLCWYQRIFMFPLAIFLPLAILSTLAGVRLVKRVSPARFNVIINLLMVIIGAELIRQAIW